MNKFIVVPNEGLSINMDSITCVTRNTPWEPVFDQARGRAVNASGDELMVDITYGPDDDVCNFEGDEALRVNAMFFQVGIHKHSEHPPFWAVIDATAPSPIRIELPVVDSRVPHPGDFFGHDESFVQAFRRFHEGRNPKKPQ